MLSQLLKEGLRTLDQGPMATPGAPIYDEAIGCVTTIEGPAMRASTIWCLALAGSLAWAGPAPADDLKGAERLLCVTIEVTACGQESPCEEVSPEELNVPRFLEVDLAHRLLSTTPASGENRQTRFEQLRREDGMIVLQGVEGGRAFSIMISEASGKLTASVARESLGVVVFGACTPAPAAVAAGK